LHPKREGEAQKKGDRRKREISPLLGEKRGRPENRRKKRISERSKQKTQHASGVGSIGGKDKKAEGGGEGKPSKKHGSV